VRTWSSAATWRSGAAGGALRASGRAHWGNQPSLAPVPTRPPQSPRRSPARRAQVTPARSGAAGPPSWLNASTHSLQACTRAPLLPSSTQAPPHLWGRWRRGWGDYLKVVLFIVAHGQPSEKAGKKAVQGCSVFVSAQMDDTDLEKAAARLRQQQQAAAGAAGTPPPPAAGTPPPPAASRHRDSLPSEASPAARRACPSGGWTPTVRPVPTLMELCTRSLCETKLVCVSRPRCALAACVVALCLPACLGVVSSYVGAFGSAVMLRVGTALCARVCVLFTWVWVDVGGCGCSYPARFCARCMHSGIASPCLTSPSTLQRKSSIDF